MFIRSKMVKGRTYHALIQGYRDIEGKVRHRAVASLGRSETIEEALAETKTALAGTKRRRSKLGNGPWGASLTRKVERMDRKIAGGVAKVQLLLSIMEGEPIQVGTTDGPARRVAAVGTTADRDQATDPCAVGTTAYEAGDAFIALAVRTADRFVEAVASLPSKKVEYPMPPALDVPGGTAQVMMPSRLKHSPEDEKWLSSFPLRAKVVAHRFDEDALLYRAFESTLKSIRPTIRSVTGMRTEAGMSLLHRALHHISGVLPLQLWRVCSRCDGSGSHKGPCRACRGGGYTVPDL